MQYLEVGHLSRKKIARLFSKISLDRDTECWNWIGHLDDGYGRISYNGHTEKVHRLMYAWLVEPIPVGGSCLQIDHKKCDNRRCCNPVHLQLTTQQVNVLRGTGPTAVNAKRLYCTKGHLLPTIPNGRGERACKQCNTEYMSSERRRAYKREYYRINYKRR